MTEFRGHPEQTPWYQDHTNLVRLVWHMAANDYPADEVARAVEKPWCYEADFKLAVSEAQFSETSTS